MVLQYVPGMTMMRAAVGCTGLYQRGTLTALKGFQGGMLSCQVCVFVAGWGHALRSEWPYNLRPIVSCFHGLHLTSAKRQPVHVEVQSSHTVILLQPPQPVMEKMVVGACGGRGACQSLCPAHGVCPCGPVCPSYPTLPVRRAPPRRCPLSSSATTTCRAATSCAPGPLPCGRWYNAGSMTGGGLAG